jgi:CheY-specific phosphatase CheX
MIENLKAATFEVLETMFFIFPESLEDATTLFHRPGVRAWVPVEGPKNFRVGLTLSLALAREMAANFLGLEKDDVPPDKMEDVVKETASMVTGSFLTREEVPETFNPKPPEALRLDLDDQNWQENAHHVLLAVEDSGLEVFLDKTK